MTPRRPTPRRGFTLAELLVSVTILSILLAAIGSATVLTARAVPTGDTPTEVTIDACAALALAADELAAALHFETRGEHAVAFYVADRDGDEAPERIAYAWSGTAGAPLRRTYGGGTATPVVAAVDAFALEYLVAERTRTARVLLVVPDASSLGLQDRGKRYALESMGYAVSAISAGDPQGAFDVAVATHEVAYVSEEITASALDVKLRGREIGVLVEEGSLHDEMGLCGSFQSFTGQAIDVTDLTHEITAPLASGELDVTAWSEALKGANGSLASGLRVLAERPSSATAVLAVVDRGDALLDARTAAGRRVLLPWGGDAFNVHALNDEGRELLHRAVEWAAGPSVLRGVRVALRASANGARLLETEARIVNEPGVSGP